MCSFALYLAAAINCKALSLRKAGGLQKSLGPTIHV
jgi:hypothetical protein